MITDCFYARVRRLPKTVLEPTRVAAPTRSTAVLLICAASSIAAFGGSKANGATPPANTPPAKSAPAAVVQSYTIDAGSQVIQATLTNNATPGDIELVIKNILPKSITSYSLTVDVETMRVVPAVLPSPTAGAPTVSNPPTCKELIDAY